MTEEISPHPTDRGMFLVQVAWQGTADVGGMSVLGSECRVHPRMAGESNAKGQSADSPNIWGRPGV